MENIKETIFKFLKIDNLIANFSGYIESRISLFKIEMQEDIARVLAKSLVYVAIMLFALLFLIFFSIGFAQYLNYFFSAAYAGFWIVSGIYLMIFLVCFILRDPIHKSIERNFNEMFKKRKDK
ncbi:MAG TPA: phage holin family protein [Cyclobacteriaceae bacterium]|jgi:uncharacterized membrane protein YqjE|nr:phage holin family protein [Cyclobacteriaceae bacterium]